MCKFPVPGTRSCQPRLLGNLFQVMLGMDAVKLAPLLGTEWTKDRMIEQFDGAPKPPLGIRESSIHGHKCIVESPQ